MAAVTLVACTLAPGVDANLAWCGILWRQAVQHAAGQHVLLADHHYPSLGPRRGAVGDGGWPKCDRRGPLLWAARCLCRRTAQRVPRHRAAAAHARRCHAPLVSAHAAVRRDHPARRGHGGDETLRCTTAEGACKLLTWRASVNGQGKPGPPRPTRRLCWSAWETARATGWRPPSACPEPRRRRPRQRPPALQSSRAFLGTSTRARPTASVPSPPRAQRTTARSSSRCPCPMRGDVPGAPRHRRRRRAYLAPLRRQPPRVWRRADAEGPLFGVHALPGPVQRP